MAAISDLPTPHDLDADYSPQYVKLARILRDKIKGGEYRHGAKLPAAALASEHEVSMGVACHALEVLEANRYIKRPANFAPYVVTWQASHDQRG